jgi:hypothetical protein
MRNVECPRRPQVHRHCLRHYRGLMRLAVAAIQDCCRRAYSGGRPGLGVFHNSPESAYRLLRQFLCSGLHVSDDLARLDSLGTLWSSGNLDLDASLHLVLLGFVRSGWLRKAGDRGWTKEMSYNTIVLQLPAQTSDSEAYAINASGEIVGNASNSSTKDAVLWSPLGVPTMFQDVGGSANVNFAFAINNAGESVGYSSTPGGCDAMLWSPSGAATVLQDVGGQGDSQAYNINASGQSVGYSATATGQDAVLWGPKRKAKVLEDIGGQG